MSRRLHISVWNSEPAFSLLLYTIHFEHMLKDDVDLVVGIIEHRFLNPLLNQKVVRLHETLRELVLHLSGSMDVDLATHWLRCASDVNVGSERTIINMKTPTITFDLVDNGVFTKIYINQEGSLESLREALA